MKRLLSIQALLLCLFIAFCAVSCATVQQDGRPRWIRDMVIYEISTKNFNSPGGPEQGTFASLREKLPYLEQLGVNAIWLTGYSQSDKSHFYNIWTQYACVRHDSIDLSLGTREQFREMIADAHSHGIRVLLDVVTHGVMDGSPLIEEHPSWFKDGSWQMTDFDWFGGHSDLDEWWVKTFTDYVVKDGVDGFRLDVATYRPDLWERIRKNAADKGHEIAILPENKNEYTNNLADAYQRNNYFQIHTEDKYCDFDVIWNVGKYFGESMEEEFKLWNDQRPEGNEYASFILSNEVSCHDNGWEGFPSDKNPYVIEGSRAMMGYSALLAPAIPIIMSGDEFDADYVPVPYLSGSLYADSLIGEGKWLYGSWIQWIQLEKPEKQAMLRDVTRLLTIRRENSELLHAWSSDAPEQIIPIYPSGPVPEHLPIPYVIYNDCRAILVAANNTDTPLDMCLDIPFAKLGFESPENVKIKDLWAEECNDLHLSHDGSLNFTIERDKVEHGGLAIFELTSCDE